MGGIEDVFDYEPTRLERAEAQVARLTRELADAKGALRVQVERGALVEVDVVFDGPPAHESGRFVEVESPPGKGASIGEWVLRADQHWALRIKMPASEVKR